MEGQIITFRARIHTIRRMSAKLVFVVLRQQTITIQAILEVSAPEQDADGQY
jgi:aspartyl/asparaginyl-tRNA synthetase